MDKLKRAVFVTWPRSGHHALMRVMHEYFYLDHQWRHVEPYKMRRHVLEGEENALKEHDLDLDWVLPGDYQVVVQTRNLVRSLESWWELHCREQEDGLIEGRSRGVRSEWEAWWGKKLEFYGKWMAKWVVAPVPRRMILCYEDLVAEPFQSCARVIRHVGGTVDEARLRHSLEVVPLRRLNRPRSGFLEVEP